MSPSPQPDSQVGLLPRMFAGVLGAFFGLALLKFGNPPIMEKYISAPTNAYEFVLGTPWPIAWGYALLGLVAVLGFFVARWRLEAPAWLVAMPLAWFFWQVLAATQTVQASLSRPTLAHFAACVVCFYLGFFALSRAGRLTGFWLGLCLGFVPMLATGWEQHFGGLEATRQYFYLYHYAELKTLPPEFLKKISSTRIFATLFYPNALAGALLLLLPGVLGRIGQAREQLTPGARGFLAVVVALAGFACLYWSGSKGGWLLMLILGLVTALRLPLGRRFRVALLGLMLLGGLAGFFWKYSGFFQRGATSVGARFDYWRAAVQTAMTKPVFGTGPGTFSVPYQKLKRPESEMARLVHNDYLEQASDSGFPGFLAYGMLVGGVLSCSFRRTIGPAGTEQRARGRAQGTAARSVDRDGGEAPPSNSPGTESGARGLVGFGNDSETFLIWLGALGWALQSVVEFGLYIPALSWPAFAFLGLLLARTRKSLGQ